MAQKSGLLSSLVTYFFIYLFSFFVKYTSELFKTEELLSSCFMTELTKLSMNERSIYLLTDDDQLQIHNLKTKPSGSLN